MRLLTYNPSIVNGSENRSLPGIARFSLFFKMFNQNVVFLDRTSTIRIPVKTHSLFTIPALRPMQKSFEDICNDRAKELLQRSDRLSLTIHVFWSGGIDSTLVLISLLKHATEAQRKRIVILLSEESLTENPRFYAEHIHGKLETRPAMMFPHLLGTKNLLIGGEHNDQLFGSDMVGKLILKFGPESIHAPYDRDTFFAFFNDGLQDPASTNFYLDLFERLRAASPVPIVSNFDLLWWINFSLKWQSVFMRMLTYVTPRNVGKINEEYVRTNYVHFYGTEDFQLWSLNNQDKKIKDSWKSYKWPCKDIIYEYTKDTDYRDNKTKRGSLHALLLQQIPFNFIDEDLGFHRELNPEEYYEPQNDFV